MNKEGSRQNKQHRSIQSRHNGTIMPKSSSLNQNKKRLKILTTILKTIMYWCCHHLTGMTRVTSWITIKMYTSNSRFPSNNSNTFSNCNDNSRWCSLTLMDQTLTTLWLIILQDWEKLAAVVQSSMIIHPLNIRLMQKWYSIRPSSSNRWWFLTKTLTISSIHTMLQGTLIRVSRLK
jgi:hypothetical protein